MLSILARTGGEVASFAPYVAAMGESGEVAFQASLAGGTSGVFVAGPDGPRRLAAEGCTSHPVFKGEGVVFYAAPPGRPEGLYVVSDETQKPLVSAGRDIAAIGPLGPTANRAGSIAFRATTTDGVAAIFLAQVGACSRFATAGGEIREFHGLPLVTDDGCVISAATDAAGRQCVFAWQGGQRQVMVCTGDELVELGAFPALCGSTVWVPGRDRHGRCCLVRVADGEVELEHDHQGEFLSIRGVLASPSGRRVFYGTRRAGKLAIFEGPLKKPRSILAVGQAIGGDVVKAFALNPVSIGSAGDLAVRLELASGAEAIGGIRPNR